MTLLIRFAYASFDKRYSKEDVGHSLLAISPHGIFVIRECIFLCRDCLFAEGTKMSEAEFQNWVLNTINPTQVHLAVHPDMMLRTSSGMRSKALSFVTGIADALALKGAEVEVSDRVNTPFDLGTWVRFLKQDHQNNYFVEEGMLGQVVPDSRHMCVPGKSITIQPLGLSSAFMVAWEDIEPIPEPDENQLREARQQALHAQR